MSYLTVRLTPAHERKNFHCGKASLDNYIKTQVNQDIKKKLAACFVIADGNNNVKGYYTLSNASVPRELVPDEIVKQIPRGYRDLPVTLLGRLAVDSGSKGQKLGEGLLMDALQRSLDISKEVGSMAIIVDPLDDDAISFYAKYGFIALDSGKMFIPMKTVQKALGT